MVKFRVNQPIAPLYGVPEKGVLIDEMLYGMEGHVLHEAKNWLYVETFYHYRGYISRNHVSYTQERQGEENLQDRIVVKNTADILDRPDYQGKILKTVMKGSSLKYRTTQKLWVEILLEDGRIGYTKQENLVARSEPKENWREKVLETAYSYLNTQYRWGGKTPWGIDCSGLAFMSYYLNGMIIYRDAQIKEDFSIIPISKENLQPADLLYFPGHVALYVGEGRMIHSSSGNNGVSINSFIPGEVDYSAYHKEHLTACGTFKKK